MVNSIKKWGVLFSSLVIGASSGMISPPSQAYVIYDLGAFVHSPSLGNLSLSYLDGVQNDFPGTGVDLSFISNLDADNLGQVSWQFSNNTGSTLQDVSLFGYLDGEIDPDINSSFNEYGQYISVDGAGAGDENPDSWEIDEPGFVFGDIYDNLFNGALDNSNAVGIGSEDDVSLALGFELGDILDGETWELILNISEADIGGLFHGDADSGKGIYLTGAAHINRVISVDEPVPLVLFLIGIFGVFLVRRHSL